MSKKILPAVLLPMNLAAAITLAAGCGTLQDTDPVYQKLFCNDAANTILCWNETTCKGDPGNFCAAHIDGDSSKSHKYPDAKFDGTCTNPLDYPQSKCACDYGVEPNEMYCEYDDNTPVDEPTTGDPTGGGPKEYLCTTHSQTKCVEYNYTVDPLEANYKDCWVDPNQADNVHPCVVAEDDDGARAACEDKCNKVLTNVNENIAVYNASNDPDFGVVGTPIDCILDDVPLDDEPMLLGEGYQCAPEYNALVAWGGSTVLTSMRATVALVTSDGGSTGYGDTIGYIGYDVSGCAGGTCTVTVDAIETFKSDVPGVFTDATGAQISYVLEDFDLHLVQEVQGTLYQSRGTIVFPTESFVGSVVVGDAIVDGVSLGSWESTQVVTQATGSVSSTGVLTLNLTLNLAGGVFTMAVMAG